MATGGQTTLVRAIGRWSLAALTINCIIASGIFGLPSVISGLVGTASPFAWLFAAVATALVMACFAEVSSRFDQTGGVYLYARTAFGRTTGITIAWLGWLARLTAGAANANLLIEYLAEFWPRIQTAIPRVLTLALLIGLLALVNYVGVRRGSTQSNLFTAAKLLTLGLFILLGIFFLTSHPLAISAPVGPPKRWLHPILLLMFAYGGYETALMPGGEAKDPRRDYPFALLTALLTCTFVYTMTQAIVISVLPQSVVTTRPMAAAAGVMLGSWGETIISIGVLVSCYGYLSANVLGFPRILFAMAQHGDLPSTMAKLHPRYRTPHLAIVLFAVLLYLFSIAGSFQWNVFISAMSRLIYYGSVCVALPVLRRRPAVPPAQFRLPMGEFLAVLAVGTSLLLFPTLDRGGLLVLSVLAVGVILNCVWASRSNLRNRSRADHGQTGSQGQVLITSLSTSVRRLFARGALGLRRLVPSLTLSLMFSGTRRWHTAYSPAGLLHFSVFSEESRMSKFIVRFLAILGALWLVGLFIVLIAVIGPKGRVPSKTILEANFEEPLLENIPETPQAKLMLANRQSLRDVVDALDRGAKDERVVGLVAKIGEGHMGVAQVQEIREAVERFRAHKKFAVAFSETFGEFGPGNSSYYLATAFDQIYLQPSGDIGLTGIIIESPFVKGTLSKLGMAFHGDHRYEYKNALNALTETKYTAPHKEAETALMNSWFGQIKDGICQARHIGPESFQAVVDAAPYLGKEAVDAKLVDGLAYRDQVYDQVKKKGGDGAELLYLDKYLDRAGRPHEHGKTVALVFGVGGVQRGKSDYHPVQGSQSMGSDTVAAAIRAAVADKNVRAILFRVDSPGGSYVASDTIWREVVKAHAAGKPVIVSMGDVAGSGGYFVAMAADKIVAQPGTITASIGVLGGKPLTSGFWEKVGISWDEVHQGNNATMFTGTHDYTPAEWARFEAWLDRVYVDFTGKVADGRKLPKEKVLEIAKGRIWSGEDAKRLGLIDELGGYDTALTLAKRAAGIPESEDVKIVVFPKPKSFWEAFLQRQTPDNSDKEALGQTLARILSEVQPMIRQLRALGISDQDQDEVLRMPEFSTR